MYILKVDGLNPVDKFKIHDKYDDAYLEAVRLLKKEKCQVYIFRAIEIIEFEEIPIKKTILK